MFGKVKIGEREVEMVANAATSYRYKQVFNEDLLVIFSGAYKAKSRIEDDDTPEEKARKASEAEAEYIEIAEKIGFILSQQASKQDFQKINIDTFYEWLEQFTTSDLIRACDKIMAIFYANEKSSSTPKKKDGLQKEQ